MRASFILAVTAVVAIVAQASPVSHGAVVADTKTPTDSFMHLQKRAPSCNQTSEDVIEQILDSKEFNECNFKKLLNVARDYVRTFNLDLCEDKDESDLRYYLVAYDEELEYEKSTSTAPSNPTSTTQGNATSTPTENATP